MKLGIGSYTYGWNVDIAYNKAVQLKAMEEADLIEKALQFNIRLLQLGDNLPMHEWNESRLNCFEKSLQQNKITLEIGARGLTEDHLSLYIHLCRRFNSKILRFVTDGPGWQPSIDQIVTIISNNLTLLIDNHIMLALENHDRFKSSEYVEIINRVNSVHLGICLDTVNSMGAGESVEYIVDTLSPHTVNLHIKEFGIARLPHHQGFIIDGRIAGSGMLNISSVLEKLKSFNRCHSAILEQWVPPEKDHGTTLKKEKDWAEKSIDYLSGLSFWN
jgi:sugar phosphate isomerase/epimerase